jgi:hypothetical protein
MTAGPRTALGLVGLLLAAWAPAWASACLDPQTGRPIVVLHGYVQSFDRSTLMLSTRAGAAIRIDLRQAAATEHVYLLRQGLPVVVRATQAPDGDVVAETVGRAKAAPAVWPPDCMARRGAGG